MNASDNYLCTMFYVALKKVQKNFLVKEQYQYLVKE